MTMKVNKRVMRHVQICIVSTKRFCLSSANKKIIVVGTSQYLYNAMHLFDTYQRLLRQYIFSTTIFPTINQRNIKHKHKITANINPLLCCT